MPNSNNLDNAQEIGTSIDHIDRVQDNFWHELTVSAVIALQELAAARELTFTSYTREQLNARSTNDLGKLRKMLHELVYAPPTK